MTKFEYKDRQVQSTKAADNNKMFTNSGRYGNSFLYKDLKQLFDQKNQQRESQKGHRT